MEIYTAKDVARGASPSRNEKKLHDIKIRVEIMPLDIDKFKSRNSPLVSEVFGYLTEILLNKFQQPFFFPK